MVFVTKSSVKIISKKQMPSDSPPILLQKSFSNTMEYHRMNENEKQACKPHSHFDLIELYEGHLQK